MRSVLHVSLLGLAVLAMAAVTDGQSPEVGSAPPSVPALVFPATDVGPNTPTNTPAFIEPQKDPPADQKQQPDQELASLQQNLTVLRQQQQVTQGTGKQDEKTQKQLELQQKQIETLEKMVRLLAEQMKKQPVGGPAVEKLQTQVTTLEARSKQAALRDQELANAVDDLAEQRDADRRNGPQWPAPLKELFLPSQTNESPLSIYGTLVGGYELFPHKRGGGAFVFDGFEPVFLLQLNDHILLEAELEFGLKEVEIGYAQMDYIVNDWLTVVAGRYVTPIGFFNERLHSAWINKLPDFPLMNRQVSPTDFSLNGLQFRGAKYLVGSPLKMEYCVYAANGLGLPLETELTALANLGEFKETTRNANEAMAWGGRVGCWVPECGFNTGFSTFFNRPYAQDAGPTINLWGIDAGYHQGNWDARMEYAYMHQDTSGFLDRPIQRWGLYAQLAYRPYDATSKLIQNLEVVGRFSFARFRGIDPTALDLSAFESPVDAPVNREQYTFGINYYLAPSAVIKFAYEINREHRINLRDNVFLAQLAWGF